VCSATDRRRCFSIWLCLFGPESTILCHWRTKSQRFEPKTMHYTTIDPQDSNPRPCTTPLLTPKSQRFEPKTMHYTTIDPQIFQPTTMHYTTIDSKKTKIWTQDHALHHHWYPLIQRFEPQIIRTASRMKYNSCVDSVSLCRITYRPDYTKWWRHTQNRWGYVIRAGNLTVLKVSNVDHPPPSDMLDTMYESISIWLSLLAQSYESSLLKSLFLMGSLKVRFVLRVIIITITNLKNSEKVQKSRYYHEICTM
jgi:hypothetical protein